MLNLQKLKRALLIANVVLWTGALAHGGGFRLVGTFLTWWSRATSQPRPSQYSWAMVTVPSSRRFAIRLAVVHSLWV
jgi:hypothetical protein